MTTRLQITLSPREADALARLAGSELRDPRDQIRLMVRGELERSGLLLPDDQETAGLPGESGNRGRGEVGEHAPRVSEEDNRQAAR